MMCARVVGRAWNEHPEGCPACGNRECVPALEFGTLPTFLFPMSAGEARKVERRPIHLDVCVACGHLFQPAPDQHLLSVIYEDYYAHYPYDANVTLVPTYRRPFDAVFNLVSATQPRSARPRLLEIGCSKPGNMLPFVEQGYHCTGVDPSPLAKSAEPTPDIEMISGLYEATSLPQKMDVIVSRFSLEHVIDAPKHAEKMRADLQDNGLVFVQVPNTAYYFRHGQPLFVAHEHVHYFTLRSLCALFSQFGLSPVALYAAGQPSIIACFGEANTGIVVESANLLHELSAFKTSAQAKSNRIRALVSSEERVVLYGCGLLLTWMLMQLQPSDLSKITVVDDNPALWGKCVPAFGLEVMAPSPDVLRRSSRIFLSLNPMYRVDVLRRLASANSLAPVVVVEADGVKELPPGKDIGSCV